MSPAERVDVLVVGAGITGAAAADALARRQLRTILVEMEPTAGHHATGRSAATLSETSGHPAVCTLAAASRSFLESPPPGFVDHPLTAERGLVWVGEAGDDATLDELARTGRLVAPSVRRISRDEVRRLVPALTPAACGAGGVHEPDARSIDVAALLAGHLRRARHHGASIHPGHEAVSIERSGAGWRITAGALVVEADWVVNAAGAWGDVVAARAGVRPIGLRPLRRTACLVPLTTDVTGWPLVMDVANRYYFEPEAGGMLVSLADETLSEPVDAQAEELDVALALERFAEATDLAPRSVRRAWAGLRTFSPDRAPVIGPDPVAERFVWCVGQGGAGIKIAPASADLVAAIVADGAAPPTDLSPARFG